MEPLAVNLEELAIVDPVAAYGLYLGIPRVPYTTSMSATFDPMFLTGVQIIPPGKTLLETPLPVKGTLPADDIAQRTWVDNITYDLQCPNIFANQVFKPMFDKDLKASPGISVFLEVLAGPKYVISSGKIPLENLVNLIRSDRWPAGWCLHKQQTIVGLFYLTQTPGNVPPFTSGESPVSQGPYTVTLSFNCWQFLDHRVDEMDPNECARRLRAAGILCTTPPGPC